MTVPPCKPYKTSERLLNAFSNALELDLSVVKGARDMLRQSAKEHRTAQNTGYATMCDMHADKLEIILKRGK